MDYVHHKAKITLKKRNALRTLKGDEKAQFNSTVSVVF